MARDLASVIITAGNESGNSTPDPSLKNMRSDKTPGGPLASAAQTMRTSSDSDRQAIYSETVGVTPLVISSKEPGRSLGKLDLQKLESLVQESLLKDNPGFSVTNSSSNFSRGTIRLHYLDQSSQDFIKALINTAPDIGYLARSPEELPRLRKFGARVISVIEVECNPALDPSKLHIKEVALLTDRKTIIECAEPEIAALIKKREGRFCFLMM